MSTDFQFCTMKKFWRLTAQQSHYKPRFTKFDLLPGLSHARPVTPVSGVILQGTGAAVKHTGLSPLLAYPLYPHPMSTTCPRMTPEKLRWLICTVGTRCSRTEPSLLTSISPIRLRERKTNSFSFTSTAGILSQR